MTRVILVTGASGFVARHAIAPLVASGAQVHASTRQVPEGLCEGVRWHRADLLDQTERKALVRKVRPDLILHAAWETSHGRFWRATANLDWAAATLELAREAAENGLQRFVGVGTCFEYGGDIDGNCEERASPTAPRTLYAVAKDATRRVLEGFAVENGLSLAWARLFLLYGPGEGPARLVPDVARNLLAGRPAQISSGRAVRDFLDARDAGGALAAIALSAVEGPVNVASGRAATVRDVALYLGRLAGRADLVAIGALPDRDEPARLVADIGRLTGEVGFHAIRPLEQGLAEALEYWRTAEGDTSKA